MTPARETLRQSIQIFRHLLSCPSLTTTMLWKLLIASFFIDSACAIHLEYLQADSAEELFDVTLDSVDPDEDLLIPEAQLPGSCWVCQWAMKKIKRQLGNDATIDVIKMKLSTVCNSAGFLRGLCKKLINKYMDTLVEELSTTDDPKTICANINVCKSVGILESIQASPKKRF